MKKEIQYAAAVFAGMTLALSLFLVSVPQASTYPVQKIDYILNSKGVYQDLYGYSPHINDLGQVVFSAQSVEGTGKNYSQLFLYESGNVKQLTDEKIFHSPVAFNNKSQILWENNDNYYLYIGGSSKKVIDSSYDAEIVEFNDRGEITLLSS